MMSTQQMRIYAKSADENGYKEPLAEHTINDIKAGRQLVANLPFGQAKKKQIGKDLDLCIAFHDLGKAATGFQASLEEGAPYWGHRHEILSAAAATSAQVNDSVVLTVLTHHKTLPSDGVTVDGCLPHAELPYEDHMSYQVCSLQGSCATRYRAKDGKPCSQNSHTACLCSMRYMLTIPS